MKSNGGHASLMAQPVDPEAAGMRDEIARTRANMSGTIDELHGKLNPAVMKERVLEQLHDAGDRIKAELLQAKAAMRAELKEAKDALRAELIEAKEAVKHEAQADFEEMKTKVEEELAGAQFAIREATIGKVEHMVHDAQNTVNQASHSLIDTLKANPLPAAMVGVGLAWLFYNSARSNPGTNGARVETNWRDAGRLEGHGGPREQSEGGHGNAVQQLGDKANEVGHAIQRTAGSAVHAAGQLAHDAGASLGSMTTAAGAKFGEVGHVAGDGISAAAHAAGEKITAATQTTRETATHLARDAEMQGRRLRTTVRRTYESNPILAGAAVMAAGTAIGLAIPSTGHEDAWMGSVRDQVMDKAGDMAHAALGKVEGVAKHASEDVVKALNQQANPAQRQAGSTPA
jgi:hypothetical protein